MSLRNEIPEDKATYPDPILGVNLHVSEEDLADGEARLMQNCVYDGGTRKRLGSQRLNSSSLGAYRILGGTKFYYGGASPTQKRLIAYNNAISVLSDAGSETNLTTGMTAGKDTHFLTWSITDKNYICNGTDNLREYDGTTFQATSVIVGSAQVPGNGGNPAARMMAPILDRLMCITTNGIERTNARVAHIWSLNSSWATLRPIRGGLFTAIAPYTVKGTDTFYPGILAFQSTAYYVITGTMFGTDVTAASAALDDASIRLIDPVVGTSSPYSVCTVPGVGMFWFTSDMNVYWLPEGSLYGRYIGDKLRSTNATAGIESTNTSQLSQVWMTYHYPYVMLGIPTGSNAYCDTQFWLDIRRFPEQAVWYGPMTGQTINRAWTETQNGNNSIFGGEGNTASGAYIYELRKTVRYTDALGSADNAVSMLYQTPFFSAGHPSRKKYVYAVNADLFLPSGSVTCSTYDLDGAIQTNVIFVAGAS